MNICIVGGGTAGWISAFVLSKKFINYKITLIESKNIPIIGVGEGVTGLLLDLFLDKDLGLDEFEFLNETQALPKYGLLFTDWTNEKNKSFYSPIDGSYTNNLKYDLFLYNALLQNKNLAYAGISGHYYEKNLMPWKILDNKLFFTGQKSYHIDAYKVGEFFKKRCNNINYIQDDVDSVTVKNNKIYSLKLKNKKIVFADYFFDCTGFAKILMSKLKNKWLNINDKLPVNRALIFKISDKNKFFEKKCYSAAIAKNSGWIFEIPTRHKIGRGYIFDENFTNDNKVVDEISKHYKSKIEIIKDLKFTSGQYENFWKSNCVVVGLSSSFLEPLQATSLHISILTLLEFVKCLQKGINKNTINNFNNHMKNVVDDIKDFVQSTYMGNKTDSKFWKNITFHSKKSDRLKEILHIAKNYIITKEHMKEYYGYADHSLWNYNLLNLGYYNKDYIKKTFKKEKINMKAVNNDFIKFHNHMKNISKKMITTEHLNSFLIKNENKILKTLYEKI